MKRLTAMVLVLCVFFSAQTVLASAESDPPKTETRSMEEILEGYHMKTMENLLGTGKNNNASSRAITSGKTLEQETVEELIAAGYEAYNVTGDNYKELEETLKTDLGSLGLELDGSYIVVISGDEERPDNGNSRAGHLIEQVGGTGDDTGGSSVVMHTYNGKTYTMRYVTVSADSAAYLRQYSYIDLDQYGGPDDVLEDMNVYISIMSSVGLLPDIGLLSAWVSDLTDNVTPLSNGLLYYANSNWHIKYVQVYDYQNAEWVTAASTEYVTILSALAEPVYDPVTQTWPLRVIPYYTDRIEAEQYNNETILKDSAVWAFTKYGVWKDTVEFVYHRFNGEVVAEHVREMQW